MVLFLLFLWLLEVGKRKIFVNITKKEIVSTFETISFHLIYNVGILSCLF
jgi:hypothetical protein